MLNHRSALATVARCAKIFRPHLSPMRPQIGPQIAAISGLQQAQYGVEFRTSDGVAVDYVRMASAFPGVLALQGGDSPQTLRAALETARGHHGLSLIHVPVYGGGDPVGGMGAYGSWNVGNWVAAVKAEYLKTAI